MAGNCFVALDDLTRAQRLADSLPARRWPSLLTALARRLNPMLTTIEAAGFGGYYWVVDQAETSTDLLFRDRASLQALAPSIYRNATTCFTAEDVLRFLGRKLHPAPTAHVGTDTRRRPQGWRVKHRLGRNSIKVYDKASCLRVETTTNDPSQLRHWVTREHIVGSGRRRHLLTRRELVPVRKGGANLKTIYQAGKAANERYLDALSAAATHGKAVGALDRLTHPRIHRGRRYAGFSPLAAKDLAVFRAVLAGEHVLHGFSNHDLTRRLYHDHPPTWRRRNAAARPPAG